MKRSAAPFMQYRSPVGAGPSVKTCPKCPPAVERTSVRSINRVLSDRSMTASDRIGRVKLGHPVPESNLSSERKTDSPVSAATYVPVRFSVLSGLENGRSVPPSRRMVYDSGESLVRHSSSARGVSRESPWRLLVAMCLSFHQSKIPPTKARRNTKVNRSFCGMECSMPMIRGQ